MATIDEILSGLRSQVTPDVYASDENIQEITDAPAYTEYTRRGLAISTAQGLMSDEEELARTLDKMRSVEIRRDPLGEPMAEIDNQLYALNKEGLSEADVNQFAARAVAYSPVGRMAGISAQALAKVAAGSAATEGGLQSIEWLMGGEFNPEEVALAGATAPVAQYGLTKGGEALSPIADKAMQNLKKVTPQVKSYLANATKKQKAGNQEEFAKEAVQAAAKEPQKLDELTKYLVNNDTEKLADYFVDGDVEVMKAIKELGMEDDIMLSHISKNKEFRGVEQGLAARPANPLGAQQYEIINNLAQKADDTITEFGGKLDKGEISLNYRQETDRMIEELSDAADTVYKQVDDILGEELYREISAPTTVAFVEKMLAKRKGRAKTVNASVMRAYNLLKGKKQKEQITLDPITNQRRTTMVGDIENPTLEELSSIRKQIGRAAYKNEGPYKDEEKGLLKALYGTLRKDMDEALKGIESDAGVTAYGYMKQADELVTRRKILEDQSKVVLGKNLADDIMPRARSAVMGLAKGGKGNIEKFDRFIEAVNPDYREQVVVSAFNDLFRGSGARQKNLSPTQFASVYNDLARQPKLKKKLFSYTPKGFEQRFDALGIYSNAISRAMEDKIPTGIQQTLFEGTTPLIKKLMPEAIKRAGDVIGAKVGVFGVGTAVDKFLLSKSDQAAAVTALLKDPAFIKSMKEAVEQGAAGIKREPTRKASRTEKAKEMSSKFIEARISNLKTYKKWYETLDSETKDQIKKAGFMAYVLQDNNDEEQ